MANRKAATYQGIECKHGHTERYVKGRHCVVCERERDSKRPPRKLKSQAAKDHNAQLKREWEARNRSTLAARTAKRKADKLNATPAWLTEADREYMEAIYFVSHLMTTMYGRDTQVDHIHPMNGKEVCGLHTPDNLQILDRLVNTSKWANDNERSIHRPRGWLLLNTMKSAIYDKGMTMKYIKKLSGIKCHAHKKAMTR